MINERQQLVLNDLREIGRANLYRHAESSPYLFQQDCKKVAAGDIYCAWLGGLSWQVGGRLDLPASAVLNVFKALEKRGLVLREQPLRGTRSPRYWWPVGLADALCKDLKENGL